MKILITGGSGYIGRILSPLLVENGYTVTVLDRDFLNRESIEKTYMDLGIKFIRDDIRYFDPNILRDHDGIVDLAALSNDPSGELDPIRTWDINYIGRSRVARLAKKLGVEKYIVSSSCSVYGYRDDISDEGTVPNPLTTYAQANVAIEGDTLMLKDKSFSPTSLRFATAFGYSPRMRFDIAINAMTLQAFKTGKVRLMRNGEQYRPFVHVKDISRSVLKTLEAEKDVVSGEIYNVGSDKLNIKLIDLANTVIKTTGVKNDLEWYGDPDTRSYRVSFRKIVDAINFRTEITVEEGIREIFKKIREGKLDDTLESHTVEHYKKLLDAKELLDRYGYSMNNRIL